MTDYFHCSRDIITRIKYNYLSCVIDDCVDYLKNENYSYDYGRNTLFNIMLFGEWLQRNNVPITNVSNSVIHDFLSYNIESGRKYNEALRASMHIVFRILQKKYPRKKSSIEIEVDDYSTYLRDTCGLRESTIMIYSCVVNKFLENYFLGTQFDFDLLTPANINQYILKISLMSNISNVGGALHRYFQFRQVKGSKTTHLTAALPSIPARKKTTKRTLVSSEKFECLLQSIDMSKPIGLRTYASALCMGELGIRVGDVVRMTIDDINWKDGWLIIKNSKVDVPFNLPLPKRTGMAIADYLTKGRPVSKYRNIFLSHQPHDLGKPTSKSALCCQIRLAWIKSGVHDQCSGTHIFRRSVATKLNREGTPIKIIADILGHSNIQSTMTYIQPDLSDLQSLVQEWPDENETYDA
ncbi:MAG: tyrosine-type recombinase/integrase [Planctomycetia bacterium]|nr:tyrosine-type recombinase/integrase [Planctomycetia bacterium]